MSRPDLPERVSPHIASLDGIRGIAILLVLTHHLVHIDGDPASNFHVWATAFVNSCWIGVDLFLALSGFLITGILVRTARDPHFFRNFYVRRALRIFPLYYGILLIVFACTPIYHIYWGGQQWRLLTYTNHLLLNPQDAAWNFYFGGRVNLVNLWTLHVEEQFYLLWPWIVFFIPNPKRLLPVSLVLASVSIVLRLWLTTHSFPQVNLYSTLWTRADTLLLGAALAVAVQSSARWRVRAGRAALPTFLVSSASLTLIFLMRHGLNFNGGHILFSIQFVLLALAATSLIGLVLEPASRTSRFLSHPVLRFFGRYSYGLYLFHSILPMFLDDQIDRLRAHIGSPGLQDLVSGTIFFAASVLLAVLSLHFFEGPILRLKRYFAAETPRIPHERELTTTA